MSYTILPNGRISPVGWVNGISPVSLFHPGRCQHENVDSQGADMSVGFYGGIMCEDCGADLTDDARFERDDWGDECDRAYDSWRDSQFDRD